MAIELEIQGAQGANISHPLIIKNAGTNTAINISSYSFSSKLRKSYVAQNYTELTITKTDSANGAISIELGATETANLAYGKYVFDVLGTSNNYTTQYFSGLIVINPGVSK